MYYRFKRDNLKIFEIHSDGPLASDKIKCQFPGCFTILNIHNPHQHLCYLHQNKVNKMVALKEEGYTKFIKYLDERTRGQLV